MAVYRGKSVPIRQKLVERYSATSGITTETEWRCFDEGQIRAFANSYAANGCDYEMISDGGAYSLLARRANSNGGIDVTIDTWQIQVSRNLKHVIESPITKNNVSAAHLLSISKVLSGELKYDDVLEEVAANDFAVRLLTDLHKGSDSYAHSGYSLLHTTNAPARYGVNRADENVDCLYSTALLLSETQNSNSWIYPLPGRLAFKIQNILSAAVALYDMHDNFMWSWLKGGSSESTAANGRINISTDYEFGEWSTDRYFIA